MKILADDSRSEVLIQRNNPNDPQSTYTLESKLFYDGNTFYGQNNGIHLSGYPAFLKSLEQFLEKRAGSVVLEMTEGCNITIFKWNLKGDVGLCVRICKYSYITDPLQTQEIVLEGTIRLNSEFLNAIFNDFKNL